MTSVLECLVTNSRCSAASLDAAVRNMNIQKDGRTGNINSQTCLMVIVLKTEEVDLRLSSAIVKPELIDFFLLETSLEYYIDVSWLINSYFEPATAFFYHPT